MRRRVQTDEKKNDSKSLQDWNQGSFSHGIVAGIIAFGPEVRVWRRGLVQVPETTVAVLLLGPSDS